jgi:predicted ATPase
MLESPRTTIRAMPTLRVVLTGGPGASKTTLLETLRARGFATVPETAREIIEARRHQGLAPRPPAQQFAEEILRQDIEKYLGEARRDGPTFFDRSVVDALGMVDEVRPLPEPELRALLALYPYHREVFVLPPWEAIYANDAARDQSFEEAARVHREVNRWYRRCGYEIVEVPRLSVSERCAYVLARLGHNDA